MNSVQLNKILGHLGTLTYGYAHFCILSGGDKATISFNFIREKIKA